VDSLAGAHVPPWKDHQEEDTRTAWAEEGIPDNAGTWEVDTDTWDIPACAAAAFHREEPPRSLAEEGTKGRFPPPVEDRLADSSLPGHDPPDVGISERSGETRVVVVVVRWTAVRATGADAAVVGHPPAAAARP
jgi:hypothetical protein